MSGSTRAVIVAIAGNSLVTLAKFCGWLVSGSPSMLAETIHSAADTANQGLLYVGIRHGSFGPTREFPWGRGQARYVWNLISAIGIFFVGFGFTALHGFEALFSNTRSEFPGFWVSIAVLIFSFAVEFYTLRVAFKVVKEQLGDLTILEYIRQGDDPTGVGVLLEDFVAVLGVGVAIIGVVAAQIFQSHVPDAIGSLAIAVLLGTMAITLAFANGRLLLGAAIDHDREEEIKEFIEAYPSVEKVVSLKTEVLSPKRVRLSIEVEFHGGVLVDRFQIEKDVERIRDGDDPTPLLVETAERTVRLVGREINRLEAAIQHRFKEIVSIDLEVN